MSRTIEGKEEEKKGGEGCQSIAIEQFYKGVQVGGVTWVLQPKKYRKFTDFIGRE
jgi:hypothetical protein